MLQTREQTFAPRKPRCSEAPNPTEPLDIDQSWEYIFRSVPFRRVFVQGGLHAHYQRRKKLLSFPQAGL